MEIKISEKPEKLPKLIFTIEVETYYGDADGYENFVLETKNENELRSIITTLEIISKQWPNGSRGGAVFSESIPDEFNILEEWPTDNYDMGGHNTLESFQVYYYDDNSNKFKVTYKLDDEQKMLIQKYTNISKKF